MLDQRFDPAEAEAWWSALLPAARIQRVQGAGRMLVFSHPETVVAALDSSAVRQAACNHALDLLLRAVQGRRPAP